LSCTAASKAAVMLNVSKLFLCIAASKVTSMLNVSDFS
jgi:hypothetical protein